MLHAKLLDHFQNPRNVGTLEDAITVEVSNPACGDVLRLAVHWREGRIAEARYQTRGCTASIAAGSALTELLIGRNKQELAALDAAAIEESVGELAEASKHAAVLCADGVRALRNKLP